MEVSGLPSRKCGHMLFLLINLGKVVGCYIKRVSVTVRLFYFLVVERVNEKRDRSNTFERTGLSSLIECGCLKSNDCFQINK